MIRILESLSDKEGKLVIDVKDSEGQLKELVDYIKDVANAGHTFDVVVDPGNEDWEKSFEIDGDGAFSIKEVKFEKDDDKVEKKEESIKSIDNFKKEHNLSDEDINELKHYYKNPWNEHKNLSFVDYLYGLADNNLLPEMLSESIKSINSFKKENELTDEMINTLKEFYNSEWNEFFKDLDFVNWLYAIKDYENGTIYSEILEDYMDFSIWDESKDFKKESVQTEDDFILALADVLKAIKVLNVLWNQSELAADCLNNDKYPFDKSLDELCEDVNVWLEETKKISLNG